MRKDFARLNIPFQINGCQLKNRQVSTVGTVSTITALNGAYSTQSIDFYDDKPKETVGMVVTKSNPENHLDGKEKSAAGHIARLKKMVNRVQRFGTKIFVELNSGAKQFLPSYMLVKRASSPIINRHWDNDMIVMNSVHEKEKAIDEYVKLATMARIVGFDGVQVDIDTGYNKVDKYTMDYPTTNCNSTHTLNERFFFAEQVVESIKMVCGDDFPVVLNINVDNEFIALAGSWPEIKDRWQKDTGNGSVINGLEKLEEAGYDALNFNLVTNNYTKLSDSRYLIKRNLVLINRIKNAVDVPVILQVQKQFRQFATRILNKGFVDAIGLDEENAQNNWSGNEDNDTQPNYWIA